MPVPASRPYIILEAVMVDAVMVENVLFPLTERLLSKTAFSLKRAGTFILKMKSLGMDSMPRMDESERADSSSGAFNAAGLE